MVPGRDGRGHRVGVGALWNVATWAPHPQILPRRSSLRHYGGEEMGIHSKGTMEGWGGDDTNLPTGDR
jgi:hypothetical protein